MTAVLHSRASVASSFVGLLRQNRISSRSHRVRRVAAPAWGWPSRSRAVHASRDDVRPRRRLGVTEEAGAAGAAAVGDPSSRDEDEGTAATHPPPQEDTSTSTAVVGTKRTITTLPSPHKVQLEQRRSLQTLRVRQIIRPLGKTRANDPDKVAWLMESIQEIGLQVWGGRDPGGGGAPLFFRCYILPF